MSKLNSFFTLSPEIILRAVESYGFSCTGRLLQLNSLENRVFEVEVECEQAKSRFDNFKVVKFYRPGRWNLKQIAQEHNLIEDLDREGISACLALKNVRGAYVSEEESTGIKFSVYPKIGGRLADELDRNALLTLGRLIARMHLVCSNRKVVGKEDLSSKGLLASSIDTLESSDALPQTIKSRYLEASLEISELLDQNMTDIHCQRIHGDFHLGNILWIDQKPVFLDFDDVLNGPVVQDLWLIQPGRDAEAVANRDIILSGYQEFKDFDYRQLEVVELLRALRMIKFNAWIHVRWEDPSFPLTFPNFRQLEYWREQLNALEEILNLYKSVDGQFW